MLNKYDQVNEDLKAMSLNKEVKCSMPPFGPAFDAAASAAMLEFSDINSITKVLQTHLLQLSKCIDYTERLIQTVETGQADNNSHWYLSDFDTDYIGPDSKKQTDKVFVSAVYCKMVASNSALLN
jgi:hypothetical protein